MAVYWENRSTLVLLAIRGRANSITVTAGKTSQTYDLTDWLGSDDLLIETLFDGTEFEDDFADESRYWRSVDAWNFEIDGKNIRMTHQTGGNDLPGVDESEPPEMPEPMPEPEPIPEPLPEPKPKTRLVTFKVKIPGYYYYRRARDARGRFTRKRIHVHAHTRTYKRKRKRR